MSSESWQLLFIDLLFLGLAGSLCLWFRAWLRGARKALDTRLDSLECQQAALERLCGQLQATCGHLETRIRQETNAAARAARSSRGAKPRSAQRASGATGDGNYQRARELLTAGVPAVDVARRLGMGLAEVEVIGRVLEQRSNEVLATSPGRSRFKNIG